MIFLGSLYNLLSQLYATKINHFALIKLIMLALDKTIFYFLFFMVIRLIWLMTIRSRRTIKSEAAVWLFAFYLILVLMLTTFRNTYFPWNLTFNLHRPLSEINFVFLKETWKMYHAQSRLDFVYNSFGNVLCFVPFGFLSPFVFAKKQTFGRVLLAGLIFSLFIETMQFLLETGVSDIDDVFFNSCGAAIGYFLYWVVMLIRRKSKTI
ncbi:VanZ family protein [Lactobacillus helsingborgensis]|uniref:VanZ family protein n=1 Tax=Lactobacillus helsingborgensis TaxID=1218494 RepID=A0AA47GHP3_9LACO|nr:VanZ family protein [Lactobacillus helsingborgensis]UZX30490.1 VanZ family protein [Lactobacillus helsingborgensis]